MTVVLAPNLVALAWDHAMGDNSTAKGGGVSSFPGYVTNLLTMNVAQNSWNYEFFTAVGTSLGNSFDPVTQIIQPCEILVQSRWSPIA